MKSNILKKLLCLLVCLCGTVNAQNKFSAIDSKARSVKTFKNAKDLSQKLTSGCKTDLEKTRSIYYWISENIKYDTEEFHKDSINSYYTRLRQILVNVDDNYNKELYNSRIVDTVLKKKKAICDGYARLFKTLCAFVNIKAEIIAGMGKNSTVDIGVYTSDHAWNSVFIKDKWFLLDACWASGTCDSGTTTFTKQRNDFYFLTEPKYFSYSHFPDNKAYFYYPNPISKQQFMWLPVVYPAFFKHGFESFTPLNGLARYRKNGKIPITIAKSAKDNSRKFQSSDSLFFKATETNYLLEQKISDPSKRSFTVYYNSEAILEYKVSTN